MEHFRSTPGLEPIKDDVNDEEGKALLDKAITRLANTRAEVAEIEGRFKVEIDRLNERLEVAVGDRQLLIDVTTEYINHLMHKLGIKRYDGLDGKASIRSSKVVQWDQSVVPPQEYVRTTTKSEADKKKVKKDIRAGLLMVLEDGSVVNSDGEMLAGIALLTRDNLSVN